MVICDAVTNNVRSLHLGAVILKFVVALRSALRGQEVRPSHQAGRSHEYLGVNVSKWQRGRTGGRIHDLVLEFQVSETDLVSEAARIEIRTNNFVTSDVLVVINGKALSERGTKNVLEIRVTREKVNVARQLVVNTTE